MTLLGRETPGLPEEVLFPTSNCRRRAPPQKGLKPPVPLGEAVRLVARIGGYPGRNNDPPPGHQPIWQGLRGIAVHITRVRAERRVTFQRQLRIKGRTSWAIDRMADFWDGVFAGAHWPQADLSFPGRRGMAHRDRRGAVHRDWRQRRAENVPAFDVLSRGSDEGAGTDYRSGLR